MTFRSLALALVLLSAFAGTTIVAAQDVGAADGSVEGEVGSTTDELQGHPNAANSTACGCSTAGARTDVPPVAIVGGIVVLGAVGLRRRRV